MDALIFVAIGLLAGVCGGVFGIGGGVVLVPSLIFLKGFEQHKAQGTSLAVFLLPVALLGFLNYYRDGKVDVTGAAYLAGGVFCGMFLGSKLALSMDEGLMRKIFAVLLVAVAVRLFLKK